MGSFKNYKNPDVHIYKREKVSGGWMAQENWQQFLVQLEGIGID